jgi:hypothetical protein
MYALNYDKRFDMLNIGVTENRRNSIGAEEYDGLVVMRDRTTREVTGLMIYDFKEKLAQGGLPVFPSDVSLCVENDVLPYIDVELSDEEREIIASGRAAFLRDPSGFIPLDSVC